MDDSKKEIKKIQDDEVKITLSKKTKKIIVTCVVVAVVIALLAVLFMFRYSIYSSAVYHFMPKELTATMDNGTDTQKDITFYAYKVKGYNPVKDKNTLNAFGFYYYDDNGKKVDLGSEGVYESAGGQKFTPNTFFLMKASKNFNTFKDKYSWVIPIVIFVVLAIIIVLWFKSWSRREDERKAKMYGNKNQNGKNKK